MPHTNRLGVIDGGGGSFVLHLWATTLVADWPKAPNSTARQRHDKRMRLVFNSAGSTNHLAKIICRASVSFGDHVQTLRNVSILYALRDLTISRCLLRKAILSLYCSRFYLYCIKSSSYNKCIYLFIHQSTNSSPRGLMKREIKFFGKKLETCTHHKESCSMISTWIWSSPNCFRSFVRLFVQKIDREDNRVNDIEDLR